MNSFLQKLRSIFMRSKFAEKSSKDTNKTVQTIYSEDEKQRVIIFQRPNGSYGFSESYFSEDEFEMCWIDQSHASFFDTYEIAQREVYSRVDWLIGKDIPSQSI